MLSLFPHRFPATPLVAIQIIRIPSRFPVSLRKSFHSMTSYDVQLFHATDEKKNRRKKIHRPVLYGCRKLSSTHRPSHTLTHAHTDTLKPSSHIFSHLLPPSVLPIPCSSHISVPSSSSSRLGVAGRLTGRSLHRPSTVSPAGCRPSPCVPGSSCSHPGFLFSILHTHTLCPFPSPHGCVSCCVFIPFLWHHLSTEPLVG